MARLQSIRDNLAFLRGNILVMTVNRALGMFARGMVFPYASLYILALGGEPEQIGLVNSLLPLAGLVMFPLAGYLTDRAGRSKLITLGALFSAATYSIYLFASSWQWIAVASFLIGFRVFQFPASSALTMDSLAPSNRAKGLAIMNSVSGALAIISPYLAGWIVDTYGENTGIRALYGVLVAAYAISGVIYGRYLEEPSRGQELERFRLGEVPRVLRDAYADIPRTLRTFSPELRAMAVMIILGYTSNAISGPFWVVYASQEIGLTASEWGLILLVSTIVRLVFYIPAGTLVDRYGRTRFMVPALIVSLITAPLFILSTTFWHVLLVRVSIAVVNAFFGPACSALVADIVPRDMRGRVMACIGRGQIFFGSSSGGTGGPGMGFLIIIPVMIGALIGGTIYAADPRLPWFVTLGSTAIALLIAIFKLRDPEQAEA
jgi:MFS transporter, PPP family, 3-phenylpropionic acid transporter